MGRRRLHIDPARPLPAGLVKAHRQYRARLSSKHPWVYFGTDYPAALEAFGAWRQENGGPARLTVSQWLDLCISTHWPARVKAKKIAPRTACDYGRDAPLVKKGVGHIPLVALQPRHVAIFRDARAAAAPVHARNEVACLSAALSIAVELGKVPSNVAREIRWPSRQVRTRLVSDDEYLAVYNAAAEGGSVRLAMILAVRTLGLPDDVLELGPRNVMRYQDGRRTLRFRRGKTDVQVEVEITGELAVALEPRLSTLHKTFIRTEHDAPYSVSGIGAMFRRCVIKAGVVEVGANGKPRVDFGLRDLRAKGATDMFRAGVPLRQIQLLLGHKSVRTTEIYIKQLLTEIVRPNEVPIIASVKT